MKRPAFQVLVVVVSALLLPVVGCFDYRSGYDISLFPLYAFLIGWVAWSVNFGWGLALTLFAAAVWFAADRASGHHYSHEWIRWERAGVHVLTFGFIAYSFAFFSRTIASGNRKLAQLEGALPICTGCKRIQAEDGSWFPLEVYIRRHSEARPEPCLCPDCVGTLAARNLQE